ncbi:MAG: class I SAM-dependent methyltransferase [Candidatus Thorarchaeota archaeon]|jgi:hypothetical protein
MSERKAKGFGTFYNELMKDEVFSPTNRFEQQWLYNTAIKASDRHRDLKIVELGTLNCTAALLMADGVRWTREQNAKEGIDVTASVWTIDNYIGYERRKPGSSIRSHQQNVENAELYDLADILHVIKADDLEFLDTLEPESVSMFWVDSLHTYRHVKPTLDKAIPLLTPDGIACGHDYAYNALGVIQAVDEWRKEHETELYGFGVHFSNWWTIKRPS